MEWSEEDVLREIAALWELDTDRQRDGWQVWDEFADEGDIALQRGAEVFIVTVEKVREQE